MDNQILVGPAGTGANSLDSIEGIFREGAQRILRSASDLTASERQLLYDFSRPDRAHYPLRPLRRYMEIAPRAKGADGVWICEGLRGFILERMPLQFIDVLEAFDIEQESNKEGDRAQFRYLNARHRGTRDAVRDALLGQWIATRLALDSVHRDHEAQRRIVSIAR